MLSHTQGCYSLFTKTNATGGIVIILVYVDDLLITGNNVKLIQEAKEILHHNFKMKDLGELRYFLGIEFARSKGGIMNQRMYALDLVSGCGLAGAKPTTTPLEQNQKLTSLEYDTQFNNNGDAKLEDRRIYQRLIGRLLYLAMTRTDISFEPVYACPKEVTFRCSITCSKIHQRETRLGASYEQYKVTQN